jgi:hypothetical protein
MEGKHKADDLLAELEETGQGSGNTGELDDPSGVRVVAFLYCVRCSKCMWGISK